MCPRMLRTATVTNHVKSLIESTLAVTNQAVRFYTVGRRKFLTYVEPLPHDFIFYLQNWKHLDGTPRNWKAKVGQTILVFSTFFSSMLSYRKMFAVSLNNKGVLNLRKNWISYRCLDKPVLI